MQKLLDKKFTRKQLSFGAGEIDVLKLSEKVNTQIGKIDEAILKELIQEVKLNVLLVVLHAEGKDISVNDAVYSVLVSLLGSDMIPIEQCQKFIPIFVTELVRSVEAVGENKNLEENQIITAKDDQIELRNKVFLELLVYKLRITETFRFPEVVTDWSIIIKTVLGVKHKESKVIYKTLSEMAGTKGFGFTDYLADKFGLDSATIKRHKLRESAVGKNWAK